VFIKLGVFVKEMLKGENKKCNIVNLSDLKELFHVRAGKIFSVSKSKKKRNVVKAGHKTNEW
jgi:hypothetical protein